MSTAADRLALCEAILALIEQKRIQTGDEELGSSIERAVLASHFAEIEREVLENPGPIEPWLVRRRRGEV